MFRIRIQNRKFSAVHNLVPRPLCRSSILVQVTAMRLFSGNFADVSKMADEQTVGVLQFVIIVAVSVIFGGILIAVVLYVGENKNGKAEREVSGDKKKDETERNDEKADESEKSSKTGGKNSKRAVLSTKEHPKQFCVLKGHTSDVLHIEFSSNGKILGSTSTGIAMFI